MATRSTSLDWATKITPLPSRTRLGCHQRTSLRRFPLSGVLNNTFVLSAEVAGGTPLRVSAWEGGAGCGGYWFISRIIRAYISEMDKVDAFIWVVEGSQYRAAELDEELKFLKATLEKTDDYSGVPESIPLAVYVQLISILGYPLTILLGW